jgi:hypothetical protein
MRGLLNFITRGPKEAAFVALVAAAIPMLFWFSAAVVGLVTMRKGSSQGAGVLVWALIPGAGWWLTQHDPGVLLVLLMVYLMAVVMRQTVSFEKAMAAGVLAALVVGIVLPLVVPDLISELVAVTQEIFKGLSPKIMAQGGANLEHGFRSLMIASLASTYLTLSLGSLMLARSWQARLYNPGGFRQEFHRLRMPPRFILAGIALFVLGAMTGIDTILVLLVVTVPLSVSGIALIHSIVAKKKLGGQWLFAFYAAVVLLGPSVMGLLVVLALFDSWLDFRNRVQAI